jgi:hypothetical protein
MADFTQNRYDASSFKKSNKEKEQKQNNQIKNWQNLHMLVKRLGLLQNCSKTLI